MEKRKRKIQARTNYLLKTTKALDTNWWNPSCELLVDKMSERNCDLLVYGEW